MVALHLEDPVEQRLELLAAVQLVAGNTGSRRRNSDIHRRRRTGPLGCRSIERIVRCNLSLGFRLQERREFLVELVQPLRQGPETAGHRTHHIRLDCRSLDDLLAGSRLRILAAGEGFL